MASIYKKLLIFASDFTKKIKEVGDQNVYFKLRYESIFRARNHYFKRN
jgi:hypothetical protein